MGNKTGEDYMKVLKDPDRVLQIMNRKMELNIPWDGASLEEKKALKR